MKYMILAGTAAEAAAMARAMQLDRADWKFLHSSGQTLGYRDFVVLRCGTWEMRPGVELREIQQALQVRNAAVLNVEHVQ